LDETRYLIITAALAGSAIFVLSPIFDSHQKMESIFLLAFANVRINFSHAK